MNKDNIRLLMRHLPAGYEDASKETRAMMWPGKVIKTPADLMWLMLTHVSQGQSLANMSALAAAGGIGPLSDVGLMKRLANCGAWFKWNLERMAPASVADYLKPKGLENHRVLAVDASDVNSGVSKFSKSWHLHYALDVFTLSSHEFKITDDKTGETLANFTAQKGDLFLGDRIYATKKGISHCLKNEADFILRLRSDAFGMCSADGKRIDLPRLIKAAATNEAVDIPVCVELGGHGLGMKPLRVCVIKKIERGHREGPSPDRPP